MLSPKSDSELKALSKYLLRLGLSTAEVPSLQRYRQKYRTLLKANHPDKGGNNTEAQEVTEAARIVFEYLTTHPDKVPREGTDEQNATDGEHLKVFERENDLKVNKGSVTFHVDKSQCKAWVTALQTHLKVKGIYSKTHESYQMKTNTWGGIGRCKKGGKKDVDEGSVSVTVFASKGTIFVQGSLYMAFVTLGLCKVADLVKNPELVEAIELSSGEEDNDDEVINSMSPVEKETDKVKEKTIEKSTKIVEPEKVGNIPSDTDSTKEGIIREDASTENMMSKELTDKLVEKLDIVESTKDGETPNKPIKQTKIKSVKKSIKKSILPITIKPIKKSTGTGVVEKLVTPEHAEEEVETPTKKHKPDKVSSVKKSTKMPAKAPKQPAENGKGDQTEPEDMKVVNDTINNIQDAMVAMRADFEKALETSNKMQLKTQEDVLDLRSLLVTVGNDIKLMETGGWKPPVPGVKGVKAIFQDWNEDPDLPQGWILDRFDSLDKATKQIESKIKNVRLSSGR